MLTPLSWTMAALCLAQGDLWLPGEPGEGEPVVAVSGLRPESMVMFTGEELLRRGHRTLGDALANIIGVDVQRTSQGLGYAMRGVPDGMTLVIDGVPRMVDGERDLLDVDAGLDLADVERIEIVRGPASAINGAGSLSGVVRVFTRAPGLTGGRIRVGANHLGHTGLSGDITVREDDTAVRLVALHERGPSAVWRVEGAPLRYINIGIATIPSTKVNANLDAGDDSTVARLSLSHGRLGADVGFVHTDATTPISSFSHGVLDEGPGQRRFRERYRLRLWSDWQLGGARLSTLVWGARHVRIDRIMLFPPRGAYPFGGRVSVHGRVWSAGAHARVDLPLTTNHRLVVATFADLADRDAYSDAFDPVDNAKAPRLVELEELTGSMTAAVEYQGDLGAGWHVTAGVAVMWRTSYALAVVPRAALSFVPTGWLTLRAAYAEGSRAPDPFDLVALSQAVVGGRVVGARANDELAPEHVRTGEIGFTLQPTGRVRATMDGFITRHEDAVGQRNDGLILVPDNLDTRLVVGGEARLDVDVALDLLRAHAGVAVAEKLEGPPLDTNLRALVAGLTFTPMHGLETGARTRLLWRGPKRVGDGLHAFVDVYVAYQHDPFEIRVAARNLLDARDPRLDLAAGPSAADVAVPAPARSFLLHVEARF